MPDWASKLSEGEQQRVAEALRRAAKELDGGAGQTEDEGTDSLKEYLRSVTCKAVCATNPRESKSGEMRLTKPMDGVAKLLFFPCSARCCMLEG